MGNNNIGCGQEFKRCTYEENAYQINDGTDFETEVAESGNVSDQDSYVSAISNHKTNTFERESQHSDRIFVSLSNRTSVSLQYDQFPNESSFSHDQNFATEDTDCLLPVWDTNSIKVQNNRGISQLQHSFQENVNINLNTTDENGNTPLHLAVQNNKPDTVEFLLNQPEIEINAENKAGDTPIFIAVKKGHHNVVLKLLEHGRGNLSLGPMAGNKTVLHSLFQAMRLQYIENSTNEESDYRKCLEYILEKLPACVKHAEEFINIHDSEGNTCLHYATETKDNDAVFRLLMAGSHIHHKTKKGVILQNISIEVLTKYLDSCVSMNKSTQFPSQQELIFDCKIFNARNREYPLLTDSLLALNDVKKLEAVLTHPIIESYLSFQWHSNRQSYLYYIFLHILFYLMLISYVVLYNNPDSFPSLLSVLLPTMILILGASILMIFVLCYLSVFRLKLLILLECIVKLLLLGTALDLIWCYEHNSYFNSPVLVILFLTFDLMILLGNFPIFSTYTEMFKIVLWNFAKVLLFYFVIILAYAFCLYTLNSQEAFSNRTNISNFTYSTINAFAMLTDLLDKPKENESGYHQFLFILGVFLLTIVLANLLNGLAVNEIHVIKKNAKLFGILSQIKFLSIMDNNVIRNYQRSYFKTLYNRWYKNNGLERSSLEDIEQGNRSRNVQSEKIIELGNTTPMHKKFTLLQILLLIQFKYTPRCFTATFSDKKIYILPFNGNTVMRRNKDGKIKKSSWRIDADIVERALEILKKRNSPNIDYTEPLMNRKIELLKKRTQPWQKNKQELDPSIEHKEYRIMKKKYVEMERALESQKNYIAVLEEQMKATLRLMGKYSRFTSSQARLGTRYRLRRRHRKIFGRTEEVEKQSDKYKT